MPVRLPSAVLEARGTFIKNPDRRRTDAISEGELGEAPDYFNPDQTQVWNEIKSQLPTGIAKSADRMWVEIASVLMLRFRTEKTHATNISLLMTALARLGMSPIDRSRCAMPVVKKTSNAFGEFIADLERSAK